MAGVEPAPEAVDENGAVTEETIDAEPVYIIHWDNPIQITTTSKPSIFPSLAVSGNTVHMVWIDLHHGPKNQEVYYSQSANSGETWLDSEIRITNDLVRSIRASLAVQENHPSLCVEKTTSTNVVQCYSTVKVTAPRTLCLRLMSPVSVLVA